MKLQPLAIASLVFICACGGSSGSNSGGAAVDASVPSSCSVVEQNTFVNDVMRDIYYWVDEMPDADPAAFESPEELLEFLRFEELDRFSAIADEAEEDAFFSNSQFIGVGIGTLLVGDDQLRITQTFSDGPARAAGLDRGFFITEINGQTIREVLDNGGVSAAFGPDTVGTPVDLRYTDLVGNDVEITIFKDVVTIDTVSASAVFDVAGKQTGYLNFRNFVEPSFAALADVFADLSGQGVQELVLDLRYNGGGLISVANYLSGLLGGQLTAGDIFARRVHNTKNVGRNINTFFQDEPDALDLSRIVVITSASTASASEMIINGLDPFLDVWLVGDDTFGKPVGSYGFSFCGSVLRPTSFANENAVGNTDYFAGFGVDCPAADELDRALGDPLEASLAEALHVIENDSCSAAAVARKSTPRVPAETMRSGDSHNNRRATYQLRGNLH